MLQESFILFYFILFYFILFYFILFYFILCSFLAGLYCQRQAGGGQVLNSLRLINQWLDPRLKPAGITSFAV